MAFHFFCYENIEIRFFLCSLKNHGAETLVDDLFDMGEDVLNQPIDEKMKYSETALQIEQGFGTFGYVTRLHPPEAITVTFL